MNQTMLSAYDTHQRQDEDVRTTEARALMNCANLLEEAREKGPKSPDFAEALRHNQELWTLFQACLCEKDNPLPKDLKTLLLNISIYVDKTTFHALSVNDTTMLNGLISINRNLATGLSKKPENMNTTQKTTTATPTPDPRAHAPITTSA